MRDAPWRINLPNSQMEERTLVQTREKWRVIKTAVIGRTFAPPLIKPRSLSLPPLHSSFSKKRVKKRLFFFFRNDLQVLFSRSSRFLSDGDYLHSIKAKSMRKKKVARLAVASSVDTKTFFTIVIKPFIKILMRLHLPAVLTITPGVGNSKLYTRPKQSVLTRANR